MRWLVILMALAIPAGAQVLDLLAERRISKPSDRDAYRKESQPDAQQLSVPGSAQHNEFARNLSTRICRL
jgi:hypothetical protein